MRAFFATFQMGIKYLWRDPINIAILIFFPIFIIFILGNALSTYIEGTVDIDPAPVAVAAPADSRLITFLSDDEISRFFELEFTDRQNAERAAADGSVVAAIIEDGGVEVICAPGGGLQAQLTFSVIDAYKQIGSAAAIASMQGRDIYSIPGADVGVKEMPLGMRVPGSIDYYAVTMLVMILLYTGLNGMFLFSKGLLSDTGRRMRTAPVSSASLIGGLLAASTITSYLQGMVTFVFAGVVYGVYWGDRIPLVLLTLFGVVLFSQSLCISLIMIIRHQGAVTGTVQALFMMMTFVSKGFSKIDYGAAEKVFQYAPNAMAHTVIFGAIYGGNEAKMTLCLILLFGVSAILFILAFLFGRRRMA